MEINEIHEQLMKGIYFMPYMGPDEIEEIKSQLSRGEIPVIGLSARHEIDDVPDNITLFSVIKVISRSENVQSGNLYNLDRMHVSNDGAEAVIIINFPESMLNIEESNDKFNEIILKSLEWSRR